ncbi:MAG: hypothetical protein K2I24_06165 [Duncaniella sp.]|nr:hypothetical protein [Duncaniella sp.]MDE5693963.1 hypothetical protein [Duncaniella sp.]
MKWIDDQDDYFLRDFNDKDGNKTATQAEGTDTPATSSAGSDTATAAGSQASSQNGGSNEFTFPSGQSTQATPPSDDDAPARSHRRRRRRRLAGFFIIVFAVLAVAFYIRYFVPYTSDTLTTGYITLVEKRGIFFKTFEGEMISESVLADTSKVYSRDFYFSIPNDSLGRLVQSYQGTGKRVTVTTQKYFGTVPWRGSQKSVITNISVN